MSHLQSEFLVYERVLLSEFGRSYSSSDYEMSILPMVGGAESGWPINFELTILA